MEAPTLATRSMGSTLLGAGHLTLPAPALPATCAVWRSWPPPFAWISTKQARHQRRVGRQHGMRLVVLL